MAVCLQVIVISCFIFLVTSQIDIGRWRRDQNVKTFSSKAETVLTHSRITCAMICEYSNHDSFVFGDDKKCQTLRGEEDGLDLQKAGYFEHWVRSVPKTQDSKDDTLFLYSEEYLYWYDISTGERTAKAGPTDAASDSKYDTKRRILYWVEHRGPLKYAELSVGKIGRARRILRKPVGGFCMDFDKREIFFSNRFPNAYGDFVRYSRKTKEQKILVRNGGLFKMWCCTVDPFKQYIFYGESDGGITRIDYDGGDSKFLLRTSVNAIFLNPDDLNLFWISEYAASDDSDDDHYISRINYRNAYGTSDPKRMDVYMEDCYRIFIHRNIIYYKTSTVRGVGVVKLDGTPLHGIGQREVEAEDDPYIFLFK